jgi:Fe-S-cluster containining protein
MANSARHTSLGVLQFSCKAGCTNCCQQKGWVYLSEDDLLRAAQFLKMDAAEFERQYVYRTRNRLRLRKPPAKQCHFLLENGCSIHPAKPTQCRLFPFWPELVEDRQQWNLTRLFCPGIGQGELIQIGNALELAHQMRTAYPAMYED